MWIVRLALDRPYTFVVTAILIVLMGMVTISRIPTDIFPEIDIPVVAAIWTYNGMTPDEMEQRVVGNVERTLVSTVSGIEHLESQSLTGMSVIKIFLQPGANVDSAISQTVATSQQVLRSMPPGIYPPLVMRYNAANVPIVQVSLASEVLTEQQLFDQATTGLRPGMATVPGAQLTYPYGGQVRQIVVDIDPERLAAWNLSASDVSSALNLQNLITPTGTAKIGAQEYPVRLNSSPEVVATIAQLPIRSVGNRTVLIRDVATVRDGASPQTNIVRVNGGRGVLQPIMNSGASTLDIVEGVKKRLPEVMTTLPESLKATLLADQSVFVQAAVHGVIVEAAIAAGLTGLLILLFLGSWRSTLIVIISIPLSVLTAIIIMSALGHTLNVMTLGGMALAVGILVDDATVEIENIHRNLHMRKPLFNAILDGAAQIATPAFVATICICIVFIPVGFISGAARFLFVPLALAVVFSVFTSYILSRTLVPTMCNYLLKNEAALYGSDGPEAQHVAEKSQGVIWFIHERFNRQFERLQRLYGHILASILKNRIVTLIAFVGFIAFSLSLFTQIGQDFFPSVDSGQIRLHVRAPAGTRIEETERYFSQVDSIIRGIIPEDEITSVIDNIGIPNSGINFALSDGSLISSADGEMLITLGHHHGPTEEYVTCIRKALAEKLPDLTFYFKPPDIVTQVLNFGVSAPIDIQLVGPRRNYEKNQEIARQITERIAMVPGIVDAHIHQVPKTPELHLNADRVMMSQMGFSQSQLADGLLIPLSSSSQAAPNYWLDPKSGVQYPLVVQTPQRTLRSLDTLKHLPIANATNDQQTSLLGNMVEVGRGFGPTNVTHYNIAQSFDVLASVQGRDLGGAAADIQKILDELRPSFPRGTQAVLRGQVQSMTSSFDGLRYGLVFAVVLVYLLLVVNFQSWTDPLIILMALPGALCGILWALYLTQTTINVPSLMGAIMCIGVSTANSILLVVFANDQIATGKTTMNAAWSAGVTRLRPVIMTALAMIIGMLPMSLGIGEGGEQNAPLGRAVIGGLTLATFTTLLIVPVIYTLIRRSPASTAVTSPNT